MLNKNAIQHLVNHKSEFDLEEKILISIVLAEFVKQLNANKERMIVDYGTNLISTISSINERYK